MPSRDVVSQLAALRRSRNNLNSKDLEQVAERAGWIFNRWAPGHSVYVKTGFWANLSIPQGKLDGRTALRLIKLVEASLYSEKEESPAEKEDLGE